MEPEDAPDIPFIEAEEVEEGALYDHHRIIVDRGQQPLRLDVFLQARLPNASRTKIQAAIEAEFIKINGRPTKASYKVKPLDEVKVSLPEPPRTDEILPEPIPLDIVYEDAALLMVNKAAGMVVHPAFGNWTGTLVNALVYHLDKQLAQGSGAVRPGLVHRIDKDTSGLLVIAKTDEAMVKLARQFFVHSIKRRYLAICWGVPDADEGTVTASIGRSAKDRRLMEVKQHPAEGKHAVTHYRVLERFGYAALIECRLETGRTHQIRVHMKYIGHTLFGDTTYGGDQILKGPQTGPYRQFVTKALAQCPRQALHAQSLGLIHPQTGQEVFFEVSLPEDMAGLLAMWRGFGK